MTTLIYVIIPAIILILLTLSLFILLIGWYNSKKDLSHKEPSYKDLLKTDEWQEKRQEILNRDNHKCVYCGTMYNLQVHHKYYCKYPNGFRVYPWNYPDDALITLCDKCHKKVHNKKKIKTYYRSYSNNY